MIWALLAFLVFDKMLGTDPTIEINVTEKEVIIQSGDDRIIVPREVYEQGKVLSADPRIQKDLSKTFRVIEKDEAIENFGLTPNLADKEPLIQVPRKDFAAMTRPEAVPGDDQLRRKNDERARLVILKVWLRPGDRKWSFEWNGVPVSTPTRDGDFFGKLDRREYLVGVGDALDVILEFEQIYDEEIGLWVNDPNTFEVTKVNKIILRSNRTMFDDE